jgi:Fe2+ transport system protein FeoA
MNSLKNKLKHIFFNYWHRRKYLQKSHFIHKPNICFHKCRHKNLPEGSIQLSEAKIGNDYKFVIANCDHCLEHRLLSMGFLPGQKVKIVANTGCKGTVMIEIKGSKLMLNNRIANNIFVI